MKSIFSRLALRRLAFLASVGFVGSLSLTAAAASTNEVEWLSFTNSNFTVEGLPWLRDNSNELIRLPIRDKETFRAPVWTLAHSPSGGRIAFRSDLRYLAIRLEYTSPPNMKNMQAYGQTGVDLYLNGSCLSTAIADTNAAPGKIYETVLFNGYGRGRVERDFTLYLPLYKEVKILGIGIDPGSKFEPPKPFAVEKPVVFYGTSITQGAAASRPGMSYEAILSRKLNLDFVNLGFSGNGMGELAVAKAVAAVDASCYVLDFGANHKSSQSFDSAFGPFLEFIRSAHPTTPIVAVTVLYTTREDRNQKFKKDWQTRRDYVEQLVKTRIAAGDKNLYLVDGAKLLGTAGPDGLVDGTHPNDVGFEAMAGGIGEAVRQALQLK